METPRWTPAEWPPASAPPLWAPVPSATVPRASWWRRATSDGRRLVAYCLIVIASLMAPLAVTAFWLNRTVLDEDRFVKALAPLAHDPAVQKAVADRVSAELIEAMDAESSLSGVLPGAGFLTDPLAGALDVVVTEGVNAFVRSSIFEQLWATSLRASHKLVVALLEGTSAYGTIENGEIRVDLRAISQAALGHIPSLSRTPSLPQSGVELTIFRSSAVDDLQTAFRALKTMALVLPLLTAALYAGAVALARRRVRALLWSGMGLALGMTLLLATLGSAREAYVSGLTGQAMVASLPSVFDGIVRSLVEMSRILFLAGMVVLLAGVVAGPWLSWVRAECRSDSAFARAGYAVASSPAGPWIYRYRGGVRVAVILLGAAVLVAWSSPGPLMVLGVIVVVALAVGILEVVAQVST